MKIIYVGLMFAFFVALGTFLHILASPKSQALYSVTRSDLIKLRGEVDNFMIKERCIDNSSIKELLKNRVDPWDNSYLYSYSVSDGLGFIYTLGEDHKIGGDELSTDLVILVELNCTSQ